jgi:hypothetical protein
MSLGVRNPPTAAASIQFVGLALVAGLAASQSLRGPVPSYSGALGAGVAALAGSLLGSFFRAFLAIAANSNLWPLVAVYDAFQGLRAVLVGLGAALALHWLYSALRKRSSRGVLNQPIDR